MRHFRSLLAACLLLLAAGSAFAAPASRTPFDHLTTGFELDGKHRETACESCHVNAVFKGTPRDCAACHAKGTRVNALPKPSGHILSTERCASCHTATTFAPAVRFDHAEALGNCASCHNGV
jgi:DnaJ-class molecular chaperone